MKRRVMTSSKAPKVQGRKPDKGGSSPPKTRGRRSADVDLREQLDEARRELREAREQQTATADVLKVISRSTFDLQTVLDTLTASATRLCAVDQGVIFLRDGDVLRLRASFGFPPEAVEYALAHPMLPNRGSATGRVALEGRPVHIEDVLADPEYSVTEYQRTFGYRTVLSVPLLHEGSTIGVFALTRDVVEPFSNRQIELATTFADQAVIAIENTRLLNELRQRTDDLSELLQQQTATSDVLKVISRSTFDLQAVLGTLVESAGRLCQAENVQIFLRDGEVYRLAAHNGFSPEYQEFVKQHPIAPGRGTLVARTALTAATVHLPDALSDPEYTWHEGRRLGGYRTMLGVPLLREGSCIGVMAMTRAEVLPFTPKQIELVTTFADQALIAIENVRLFEAERERTRELSASLDQQTAASEVLQLISSSPGELGPVFQTMLENAVRICGAKFGTLFLREADVFRVVATHNAPPAHVEALTRIPLIRPPPDVPLGLVAATKQVAYVADIKETQSYRDRHPFVFDAVELAGYRSVLAVPMLKDKELVGSINILRPEVGLSATSRSSWFRVLPSRRLSRSRTRVCSMNCASRCSSRLRLPMCSR